MMTAVVAATGPEGPRWTLDEVDEPRAGPTEVLVAVRAAGLNRADLTALERQAAAAEDEPPVVVGREFAGEVVASGDEARLHTVGDRVMAMGPGAFAELVTVDERLALPVPASLDWIHAAAAPMGYLTEYNAMVTAGRLRPGDAVLVQGATSGVGAIGVQLAAALGFGPVIGTSRSAEKLRRLEAYGLDVGVVTDDGWPARVLEATDAQGVAAVIDHVGASMLNENLQSLCLGGRLVQVGRLGGRTAEIDLDALARRRHELIGVTFRTRSLEQRAEIAGDVARAVLPLVTVGSLGPPLVHAAYAWEDVEAARVSLRASEHIGKLVLTR